MSPSHSSLLVRGLSQGQRTTVDASERGAQQGPRFGVGSFLVADIRGYTAFTSTHGDEAAARLAAAFAEVMAEGVEAWAGTLVELRGDEALAVFDSPRSAIRAALELASAFRDETQAVPGLPLAVGFGLDAGEATPLGDGYRGAALNVASRLCAVAAAGEVRASASLVHLAGPIEGIDYGPAEQVELKGMAEPVAAIQVTSAEMAGVAATVASPGAAGTAPSAEPLPLELDPLVPLAGRSPELRWLAWHWRRARHGHGRCVVISGLPGIGKTRLAAELASRARADGANVRYFPSGRGLADDVVPERLPTSGSLLIVDDLDAASSGEVDAAVRVAKAIDGYHVLLVVIHRTEASAALLKVIEPIAQPNARRELGPLDLEAARAIAALYAGDRVDELPLVQILDETQGHPASVHQAAYVWARRLAAQRVSQVASRTAVERQQLLDVELELMDGMADFELARELGRRYGGDDLGPANDDEAKAGRTVCPYKGLAAYGAADADLYFGRERLVAELTAKLVGSPFLGIVGASGSGKSSALQAGLLPALAAGVLTGSESWTQVVMRPGDRPMAALGDALARIAGSEGDEPGKQLDVALSRLPEGGRLVLAVEQFEETFSAVDGRDRSAFIDLLCGGQTGLVVVVTLRADHYAAAAAYPELARLLTAHQVLVGTLTRSDLRTVIERPAEHVGLRVEPELTEALIDDAGNDPSILPLLSTALLEAWTTRQDGRLTLASYRSGGGLHGSVARLAEGVWVSLDPDRQSVARAAFLRLAGSGEGALATRRRVALDEFDAAREPLIADVLERLVDARLLTTDEQTIEVTHEALFREWPRLRGWLEDDAGGRRIQLHLATAAREWDDDGRTPADLYRGARLSAALEWAADHPDRANALEREFLEAGRKLAQREADDQRRANRRLRALLAGTGALLLVVVVAGIFAAQEAARADRERDVARVGQLTASAIAALDSDPSLAKLLAVEAATSDAAQPEAITALHRAVTTDPIDRRIPLDEALTGMDWPWVDADPTARWAVVTGEGEGARPGFDVFDLAADANGGPSWRYSAPDGAVASTAHFTPDGSRLVGAVLVADPWTDIAERPDEEQLGIGVWTPPSGDDTNWLLADWIPLGVCGGSVVDVSDTSVLVQVPSEISSDGPCFGVDGQSYALDLVSLADHQRRRLTSSLGQGGTGPVLSADGRLAAFEALDDDEALSTVVIDAATGSPVWSPGQALGVQAISHDGSLLVTGQDNLRVWDIASKRQVASFPATGVNVWGVTFETGDDAVLSGGSDGVVRRWDPWSGREFQRFRVFGISPRSVGDEIGVIGRGGAPELLLIDPDPLGEPFAADLCQSDGPRGVPAIAAGNLAVVDDELLTVLHCEEDDEIEWRSVTYDPSTGALGLEVPGVVGQRQALAPDGSVFARQDVGPEGGFGDVTIRDIESGAVLATLTWDRGTGNPWIEHVKTISWSPDGGTIAATSWGGGLRVWDVTGSTLMELPAGDDAFTDVTFTPDGHSLLLARASESELRTDASIDVIPTETWTVERSVMIETGEAFPWTGLAGFSSDGATLYVIGGWGQGSGNDTLLALDAATLEVLDGPVPIGSGNVKSTAVSPDQTLATGLSGGILKIWDGSVLGLRQEIDLGELSPGQEVQGLAWRDASHLMVALSGGVVLELTTDPDELLDLARETLTRTFTESECARFEIDPCPTLKEMQGA